MSGNHETGSASWNDLMYLKHPTPYGRGLAGVIQSRRVGRVLEFAAIRPGDRVLEIGCEQGNLSAAIPRCARLVAGDISMKALQDAQELFARQGREAEFLQLDAMQRLPFQLGEFDVIICSEVLEHVSDPGIVIANLAAICTINTRLVLSVPLEAPKVILKRWFDRLGVLSMFFPGIEPEQSEWHLHAFSRDLLRELTEPAFICDLSSVVWGCHVVARYHRKGQGVIVPGPAAPRREMAPQC